MVKYTIYQTNARSYRFMSWDIAKKYFRIKDYQVVYCGSLQKDDDYKVLNELFVKFNTQHPEDYRGRSLSVSDVVSIERDGDIKYYYCDSIGWKSITPHKKVGSYGVTCINRTKKNGKYVEYCLKDATGTIRTVKTEQLKEMLKNGFKVDNIKLTTDGKILVKK